MKPGRFLAADADRRQVAVALVVVGSLLAGGVVLTGRSLWILEDPDAVRELVAGFGPFAPGAFVFLQAAQVVVAPIPGHVTSFAGGYLFGPVRGFAYSILGATIGTYVALALARRYGRPLVERFVAPGALERFDRLLAEYGLAGVFLVFLLPGFPDDVVCLVAGCSDLDVRKLLVASVLGRAPGYLVLALSGAGIAEGQVYRTLALLSATAVVGGVLFWRRHRLLRWLGGRFDGRTPGP